VTPGSGPDVFARATTRLVALFTAIVVLLVVVSGVVMYLTVKTNITGVAQGRSGGGETEVERELASRSISRLRWQLVALDGAIIVAVGGLGLWYARRTLRPIRELYGAQKRFVADASHELRTPLAIMKADFEVALRDEAGAPTPAGQSDELREAVLSGLEEVDRMGAIVDDLLTASRIDAHQEELRFAPVDLGELVRRTAEAMQTMGERARVAGGGGGARPRAAPPPPGPRRRGPPGARPA
jgi:signal transduction histidine kinase